MRSRVYATVGRPSVSLSVCPIRLPHAAAAGLLLWARRPGDIDRLLHGRRAGGQQQPRRNTTRSGKCGQCHVVRWHRKLNTCVLPSATTGWVYTVFTAVCLSVCLSVTMTRKTKLIENESVSKIIIINAINFF